LRFYIVDVFGESKYSGNQLAVFRDSGNLTGEEMQRIAQEMHFSETTFITSEKPRNGGYDVRVFTPSFELPFAGHPTLGTAYIVQSRIIGKPTKLVKLNMKVGQIPVTFSFVKGRADLIWMRQKEPTFGRRFKAGPIGELLGLRPSDFDRNFPIMQVSTGIPFIIVPLKGLKAVRRARAAQNLPRFLKATKSIAILVFSGETYHKENNLNVRVLGAAAEIPEDPATGSANGCLAAYLVMQRYFGKNQVDVRVEQGYEIGRKSLLLLRARETARGIEVNVGGKVHFVASGEFPDED
jgi:trans-2,3-dihydro-3-hydroxyanthranilate isomerase